MNPRALFRNYVRSGQICSSSLDRIKYLRWLYGGKASPEKLPKATTIHFRLAAPVEEITLEVRPNGGSDAFIFSEVFQHRYYDFDLTSAPITVLDLGANIGLTAVFLGRKYPAAQIACVEPMPGNLSLLRTNLERNRVAARVFANAISAEDRPLFMQVADQDYGHKVATGTSDGQSTGGKTLRVEGISVPTLMANLGWERIGLLKVDIEGYENVLLRERCDWLQRVDAMCIECHEGYGEDDLRKLAEQFGFLKPETLAGTILLRRDPPSRGYNL